MAQKRLNQLDLLRAIATLLVVGRHPVIDPGNAGLLNVPAMAWYGSAGPAWISFVLSGFSDWRVIVQRIQAKRAADVRRFLIRHAFKIWPAYYVFCCSWCLPFV